MRLNFNTQILDQMREGVVLLNRQANVLSHNVAATPWIAFCEKKEATLKLLIDQAVMGRVELPVKLNLFAKAQADGVPPADAWLCRDGLQDYAVFLSPHAQPVSDPAVTEKRYVSLLGEEILGQMQQLRSALQVNSTERAVEAVSAQCAHLDSLLRDISDLSLLMQRPNPFDDERIDVDLLLQELLPRLQLQFENPFVFKPGSIRQGMLYGNAPWLSYALGGLLVELGNSAPQGSKIMVAVYQMGGFLVLTGKVAGDFGKKPVKKQGLTAQGTRKATSDAAYSTQPLITKRIIELHSGTLKINFLQSPIPAEGADAEQIIESFALTIPTGVPGQQHTHHACSDCPIAQQAQIYASDMSILLTGEYPAK